MKTLLRAFLRLFFGFRAYNVTVLQTPGPVLLIPNHVSWFDWLFLLVCLERDWRFVVSSVAANYSWLHRKIMLNRSTFPIDPTSPYAVKRIAEYLQSGGRLVLFAEGRLSRTGTLMKLFDGTGFLLLRTRARIITCYLRGAQRLPYSPHPGWKKLWMRVTAHFSEPLTPPRLENASTTQARTQLTTWLRDRLVDQQFDVESAFGPKNVLAAIAETARFRPEKIILEDGSRQEMTYRRLLVGANLLAQQFGKLLPSDSGRVGILLPNANATPMVVLALWAIGKVPAVLNFSTGLATMLACARLAGLKHIITSRAFLERSKLKVDAFIEAGIQILYLEEVSARISGSARLLALLRYRFNPQLSRLPKLPPADLPAAPPLWQAGAMRRAGPSGGQATLSSSAFAFGYGATARRIASKRSEDGQPDAPAVVLFTSGSEGVPKGVELSHANLLANIRQMLAVTDLQDTDRVFNCMPLFHSFGLTVGTLLPLVRGMYTFIYPSPLHYRLVPTALYDRDCTVFLSTNTFLNGYARKAHPYDFRSMRYLFAAAEKLQEATAQTWSRKYGVRVLEGYGATECAPCVCVNTPLMPRHGSVGRIMPGMEYKLEPVEGVEEGGRLFVRGPNVMRGYLNPDADAQFKALDGWYDTGDIVSVDADGYFHIRGRLKRFAKVSGEMVSLTAVEDALAGAFPHYGLRCQVAVLSRPDEDRGEALIAVTNEPKLQLDEIRSAIKAKGLSNLCVPREIKVVREIPKLGTGKVNHRELAKILIESPTSGNAGGLKK